MEWVTKLAWGALVALHISPAAVAFAPSLVERLYGVSADGDVGLLLVHRGALFLAVAVAALVAMFDPGSRKLASVVVAISMISFLLIYARAGMPAGALRTIAIADLAGVPALVWVAVAAWKA